MDLEKVFNQCMRELRMHWFSDGVAHAQLCNTCWQKKHEGPCHFLGLTYYHVVDQLEEK
jgi:hypothetical protein